MTESERDRAGQVTDILTNCVFRAEFEMMPIEVSEGIDGEHTPETHLTMHHHDSECV